MQPTFNPWMGYFHLILSSDIFVFLDNVQLERRSWQTRNKIKIDNKEFFVTIPIKKSHHRNESKINNSIILDEVWITHLLKILKNTYSRSKHFEEVYNFLLTNLYNNVHILSDYNINLIKAISEKIGISTKFIIASELGEVNGKKDELLLSICKSLNCTIYLSPKGSSVYLKENCSGEKFKKSGIDIFYQNYNHPVYNQIGNNFISHLGIFDLLFNEGFDRSFEIIKSGHSKEIYYKDLI